VRKGYVDLTPLGRKLICKKKKNPPLGGVHAPNSKNRGSHLDVEFLKNSKEIQYITKIEGVCEGVATTKQRINKRFLVVVFFVDFRYSIFVMGFSFVYFFAIFFVHCG
jgi:hypothetical protein